ncbi:MAG: hypothetical protein C4551_05320 [Bacillota bacterium]|nr:MAG: hypothetical protein C4551_05320 [Bacillota bacterium]
MVPFLVSSGVPFQARLETMTEGVRRSLLYAIVALGIAVYTGNYALETWRSGNRFGGVVLFILALASFALPAWAFTSL